MEEDPFVRLFQYGNSEGKEGYWSYEHMVTQLEDCLDVLTVVNGKRYAYLFLFDHSCGHDRMPADALNIMNMNVDYGGKKPIFRDTIIEKEEGYLGRFSYSKHDCPQLNVGDKQEFSFKESDVGPFNLSKKDREEQRYDINLGRKRKKDMKKQLQC